MRGRRNASLLALVVATAASLAASPQPRPAPTVFEAQAQAPDRQCSTLTSLVPTHPVRVDGLFGPRLTLKAHVLLDVPRDRRQAAKQLIAAAADATYRDGARVDVRLTWSLTSLRGTGAIEAADALAHAKKATGGVPPNGADVVYLLTDNDLTALGNSSVAGMADCVGGISNPSQAYAVGEFMAADLDRGGLWGTSLGYFANITGKVFSHEVAHLLGAHHHYANCVEGVPSQPFSDVLSACTLMFNDVGLASLNLSQVNIAVVRGHVARWGNAT